MNTLADTNIAEYWDASPMPSVLTFRHAARRAWLETFGDRCPAGPHWMLFSPTYRLGGRYATLDHIVARTLGGSDALENLRVICHACNQQKAARERAISNGLREMGSAR